MAESFEAQDLKDRLKLIETMMAEGRRTTESWGWTFVLWGLAYFVAIAWSTWGHSNLAWPVTMIAAAVVTGVGAGLTTRNRPGTTLGRSIGSVWTAMGISMFLLFMAMGMSGRFEPHTFVAIVAAMLGMANATSGMILKWKMQFACAVVWWVTAVAACFVSESQCTIVFLAAIFLCQIVFGIYGMMREAGIRRQRGAAHA